MMPDDWKGILRSITAPVILFGLFIMVFGTVAIFTITSQLEVSSIRIIMLGIGILTLIVLCGIFYLVIFKPENLMFSESGYLEKHRLNQGSKEQPVSRERIGKMERKTPLRIQTERMKEKDKE